jgi:hypothetical protein
VTDTTSTIAHSATVEAVVNAPEFVTLYSLEGEAIQVASTAVAKWLGQGWQLSPHDVDALVDEINALAPTVAQAWIAYARETNAAGAIVQAAQDAAHAAMYEFTKIANGIHQALHARYDVPESGDSTDDSPAVQG